MTPAPAIVHRSGFCLLAGVVHLSRGGFGLEGLPDWADTLYLNSDYIGPVPIEFSSRCCFRTDLRTFRPEESE